MKTVKLLMLFSFAKLFTAEADNEFYDFDIKPWQLGENLNNVLSDPDYEAFKSAIDAYNSGWIVADQNSELARGELIVYSCCRFFAKSENFYWLYGIATGEFGIDENGQKYWYVYNGKQNIKVKIINVRRLGYSFCEFPSKGYFRPIYSGDEKPFGALHDDKFKILGWRVCEDLTVPNGWYIEKNLKRKFKRGELILYYNKSVPWNRFQPCWILSIIMGQDKIDQSGISYWTIFGAIESKPSTEICRLA